MDGGFNKIGKYIMSLEIYDLKKIYLECLLLKEKKIYDKCYIKDSSSRLRCLNITLSIREINILLANLHQKIENLKNKIINKLLS